MENLPFTPLGTNEKVITGAGPCALLEGGNVKCWSIQAFSYEDTLARGNGLEFDMGDLLPYVNFGVGVKAKAIASGGSGSNNCIITFTDQLKCWGSNVNGQLGLGDTLIRGRAVGTMGDNLPYVNLGDGRTVKMVSCGYYSCCAIDDINQLKCWGRGLFGLGYGNTDNLGDTNTTTPNLIPAIDLGTGRYATYLSVLSTQMCAVLDNGWVKCWGKNSGVNNNVLAVDHLDHIGDTPGEMGDNLLPINLGTGFVAQKVDCGMQGAAHCCATSTESKIKCWGANNWGQLGYGDLVNRGDSATMGDNLPYVDVGTGLTVRKMTLGIQHTCALLSNHQVKCWGRGVGSGHGDNFLTWGDEPNEMGDNLPFTVAITSNSSSCISLN